MLACHLRSISISSQPQPSAISQSFYGKQFVPMFNSYDLLWVLTGYTSLLVTDSTVERVSLSSAPDSAVATQQKPEQQNSLHW